MILLLKIRKKGVIGGQEIRQTLLTELGYNLDLNKTYLYANIIQS